MRTLVTGTAGFIGSNLVDQLLADGEHVIGVDCFTSYYDPDTKHANLTRAVGNRNFELIEADLRDADLAQLVDAVDVVFHQAGQPGVRLSWSDGFAEYTSSNILATQRLLEAARTVGVDKFVFASSSSVYGNAARYPTSEDDVPHPHSPYGVTKLAAEHLCTLYADNWSVPTVSLRYFTVYGPRQRPDMAIHRLLDAGLRGEMFPLYGDGLQRRDFTFVGDVVAANLLAAAADTAPGEVVNISGGSSISIRELIEIAEQVLGCPIALQHRDHQAGDVRETGGTKDRARRLLAWEPTVGLEEGLTAQAQWHRSMSTLR